MSVRDASGLQVASTSYGPNTATGFKALSAGVFTVELFASNSNAVGAYTLTASDAGLDDHGETAALGTPIVAGAAATLGSLQFHSDKDVFTFAATVGNIFRFTCTTSSAQTCALYAKNPSLSTVTSSYSGTSTAVSFVASMTGTYSVEVTGDYYSNGIFPRPYSVQLVLDGADDHGDTPATGTPLGSGVPAGGNIQFSGDKDVFTFPATSGKVYSVTCTSQSSNLCALMALDATGSTLAYAYQSTSSKVSFKAVSSGTFSARVAAYSSYTGSYSVELTEVTDDHGDVFSAATPLALSTSVHASFEWYPDQDWFLVMLNASTSYTASTTGVSAYVAVYNANGYTQLGSPSFGSKVFTTTVSGAYYVKLSPYSSTGLGAYTLQVQ